MLNSTIKKLVNVLEEYEDSNTDPHVKLFLQRTCAILASYKRIDFYSRDVQKSLSNHSEILQFLISNIQALLKNKFNIELANTLSLLEMKQRKIEVLLENIPQGLLDIKRAMLLSSNTLSKEQSEDKLIKEKIVALQKFLSGVNKNATEQIKQGGQMMLFLQAYTDHFLEKFVEFKSLTTDLSLFLKKNKNLTEEGKLVYDCINTALLNMPSQKKITKDLKSINRNREKLCSDLSKRNATFFYMPYSEDIYHFDFPKTDLAGTGGNCYGETMTFILCLQAGAFKPLCPETTVLNFQIDQTRRLAFTPLTVGRGETEVSATSKYQSLQWEDINGVFFNNPQFKYGDICGVVFSMNEYTLSQRDFTPRHISIVAKLDPQKNPYSYIIFDKSFGAFGVTDEASLEYVFKVLMSLYEGMSYSKIKLTKYGEATQKSYELLNSIKPIQLVTPEQSQQVKPPPFSFFNTPECKDQDLQQKVKAYRHQ